MELPPDAIVLDRHPAPPHAAAEFALPTDRVFGGVPCLARTPIRLHLNGRIARATVARSWMPGDLAFDRGDVVTFRDDGSIESAALARSRTFGGVPAADAVELSREGVVERIRVGDRMFDADGRLRVRRLKESETIGDIVCEAGSLVRFHANGRLEAAELGAPTPTSHGVVPRRTLVNYDDGGRLVRARVADACTLATTAFAAGDTIRFDPDGPHREERWRFSMPDIPVR